MDWIDISQTLEPGMTVWPGDTAFETSRAMDLDAGDPYTVGSITLGLHTGTHADAPSHFERSGAAIADCELRVFVGPVFVLEVPFPGPIDSEFAHGIQAAPLERLIFKTGTGVEQGWHEGFSFLSAEAAQVLVDKGVRLLGLDTPSVDEASSLTWPAHRILAAAGVVILENLRLAEVESGWYELVALPLKLKNLEASPVRAVLKRLPTPAS
jgi:arylformamidase